MRYIFILAIALSLVFGAYKGYELSKLNKEQTSYKEALAEINKVNYGLFNLELWKEKALDIFTDRISHFEINPAVYGDIEKELNKYLRSLYVEYISSGKLANTLIDEGQRQGKLPPLMANLLKQNVGDIVKGLNLQKEIPSYSKILTVEIQKNEPMLKGYLQEALSNMIFEPVEQEIADRRMPLYKLYGHTTLEATNKDLRSRILGLQVKIDDTIKIVYGIVLGGVLLSLLLYTVIGGVSAISLVTAGSIILLLLGVTLPMIDIDARLNDFSMSILGNDISFEEQYLYYQSKSILDVTNTLIKGGTLDLKIVGVMILLFSAVIPFFKLVLSTLFLYADRIRRSKSAKGIIYHLGKWSMADVFVVAIFMAYIGFYGIITAQLGDIGRNQTGYAVETLNYSKLSPGALFFTTYCILSIISGVLIKKWNDQLDKVK